MESSVDHVPRDRAVNESETSWESVAYAGPVGFDCLCACLAENKKVIAYDVEAGNGNGSATHAWEVGSATRVGDPLFGEASEVRSVDGEENASDCAASGKSAR